MQGGQKIPIKPTQGTDACPSTAAVIAAIEAAGQHRKDLLEFTVDVVASTDTLTKVDLLEKLRFLWEADPFVQAYCQVTPNCRVIVLQPQPAKTEGRSCRGVFG